MYVQSSVVQQDEARRRTRNQMFFFLYVIILFIIKYTYFCGGTVFCLFDVDRCTFVHLLDECRKNEIINKKHSTQIIFYKIVIHNIR